MTDKIRTVEDALELVPDGTTLGIGGVLLKRKPMGFLAALARSGRRRLSALTFLGSLDVELLAATGALASFSGGYVGFEHLGFAPAYRHAVESGTVTVEEHSEMLFIAGLRAAAGGLPFFPTKGAMGSDLVGELGVREIADPYTGQPVLVVPPIRPQVTVIHAEVADEAGNVLGPRHPNFLSDFDVHLARASDRVVVTVERAVHSGALERGAILFGYEIDAVVVLPGGAAPTAMPDVHAADLVTIGRYLDAAPSPSAVEALLGAIG